MRLYEFSKNPEARRVFLEGVALVYGMDETTARASAERILATTHEVPKAAPFQPQTLAEIGSEPMDWYCGSIELTMLWRDLFGRDDMPPGFSESDLLELGRYLYFLRNCPLSTEDPGDPMLWTAELAGTLSKYGDPNLLWQHVASAREAADIH